ncbi:Uncharacterised protein [Kingella potus]|uniref:DNA mimic protein DMP19 C-terminal domain-containing protein n=1 Tax=Kingella potus TaxID=265175 RepID=A0A377R4C4_9NEIS|nr:DUF4375 domain-containing protein [Kingella potus]UOP00033.1 DMP19 family protein [Kingella potus]STR03326.1 Uncharacterised protein [Kingella potus]
MKDSDFDILCGGCDDEDFQKMLSGMSEEERAEFRRESRQLFAEVAEMFDAFDKRTIHEKLTEDILAQTSDEDLVLTVFDTLAVQAPESLSEEEYLQTLSPARRAVYALYILAGEVDNGGFNQYYYNTEAEAAAYLPEACELIGAPEYADLVRRANACYEQEKLAQRQDGTLETFCASYENNPLEAFDDEFYLLENRMPLDSLLTAFVRAHPSEFAG